MQPFDTLWKLAMGQFRLYCKIVFFLGDHFPKVQGFPYFTKSMHGIYPLAF
jgi:hypothetical protein